MDSLWANGSLAPMILSTPLSTTCVSISQLLFGPQKPDPLLKALRVFVRPNRQQTLRNDPNTARHFGKLSHIIT